MVAGMHATMGDRIDALCRRQCAFALYCLPGEPAPVFCMAADGRTEDTLIYRKGFVVAAFNGETLFIPSETDTPPAPESWAEMQRIPTEPETSRDKYSALFHQYTEFIRSGEVRKLVLARTADTPVAENFSPCKAFLAACHQNPNAFKALVHTPRYGTWLFCTPEQLLIGSGEYWQTMALAGTRISNTLPWDAKNCREQALVAEFIRDVLSPLADTLEECSPENLRAGRIEHLCTRFRWKMPAERVPELLSQLPPTPAVCGSPVVSARQLLQQYPDIDRSCYAGYLGPWAPGTAQFYVALRCMQVLPGFCRLYAGGGLMPDSVEEQEWLETENKMACMRQAIEGSYHH